MYFDNLEKTNDRLRIQTALKPLVFSNLLIKYFNLNASILYLLLQFCIFFYTN